MISKPLAVSFATLALLVFAANMDAPFYLDSGASYHMVCDAEMLSDLEMLDTPIEVNTGNGTVLIQYKGTSYFQPYHGDKPIQLNEVLFNPYIKNTNLISMGRMMKTCYVSQGRDDKVLSVYTNDDTIPKGRKLLFKAPPSHSNVFPVGTYIGSLFKPYFETTPEYIAMVHTLNKSNSVSAELLHRRFGHIGYSTMKLMNSKGLLSGFNISNETLDKCLHGPLCEPCVAGKLTKQPFPDSDGVVEPILHVDISSMGVNSLGGGKHMAVCLYEPADISWVAVLKNKNEAGDFTKAVISLVERQTGHKLTILRSDNGGEYINESLGTWLTERGIQHHATIPYTPQQNGKAERLNRTLQEMVRAMLADSDAPAELWGEALHCANRLRNMTLRPSKDFVPFTEFYGKPPNYADLRVFGCKAYVHTRHETRNNKVEKLFTPGMMIGYALKSKGYRILQKDDSDGTWCVVEARDVVFDETRIGIEACFGSGSSDPTNKKRARSPSADLDNDEAPFTSTGAAGAPSPVRGRNTRARVPSKRTYGDYYTYFLNGEEVLCLLAEGETPDSYTEPLTLEQAMASPQWPEWEKALNREIAALLSNKTWTLVNCPPGVKPLPGRWVFKIKRDASGAIERFKCRWVAKGFKQIYGVDYMEISAPVAKMTTVRTVLALAAANNWELVHLDTDTAFLHGVLDEPLYMEQPHHFETGDPNTVCQLHKCIYGLKQAPRVWHQRLKKEFEKHGFRVSFADASVLMLDHPGKKTFALIYVDDQIITGPDNELNATVKKALLKQFPGKDLGEAKYFLGLAIERNWNNRTMKLTQTRHIDDLVTIFGQKDAKPVSVPMTNDLDLSKNGSEPFDNKHNYSSLVGSLLYLSQHSRPDIAYSASLLSRYLSCPTKNHWLAAIKVLRYLNCTRTYGLVFGNTVQNNGLSMVGYSDSNFAGDKDDSISTYGYCFILNGAAVSWTSRKQDRVAHSTSDAEYVAASHATREALWFNKLLHDCDLKPPITLYMDNTTAINYVTDHGCNISAKNKHIAVHIHAVFERIRFQEVKFMFCPTEKMVADIFTKPLARAEFEKFRALLGIIQ